LNPLRHKVYTKGWRQQRVGIYAFSFSLQVGQIKRFGIYAYPNKKT
jgi:hypothetical protein